MTKLKPEEEWKDKNQLLEAVNKQLHQKLMETQVRSPPSPDSSAAPGPGGLLLGGSRPAPAVAHPECKRGSPPTRAGSDLSVAAPQGELKDLTQKVELLEKFQDNCLAILESKGLNPGERRHTLLRVPFPGLRWQQGIFALWVQELPRQALKIFECFLMFLGNVHFCLTDRISGDCRETCLGAEPWFTH